jgi:hypothetical protein
VLFPLEPCLPRGVPLFIYTNIGVQLSGVRFSKTMQLQREVVARMAHRHGKELLTAGSRSTHKGYSSMVDCMLSMHEDLGLSPPSMQEAKG